MESVEEERKVEVRWVVDREVEREATEGSGRRAAGVG